MKYPILQHLFCLFYRTANTTHIKSILNATIFYDRNVRYESFEIAFDSKIIIENDE